MSGRGGLGLGGFLVGLGAGWVIFQKINVSGNLFAWILILAGVAVIASSLSLWKGRSTRYGGLVVGLVRGLILSLFITSGFVLLGASDSGYSVNYRAQDTRVFSGALTADSVLLDVNNFNGPITVSTWAKNEYSISALIKAKGNTDAEAEENLEKFEFDLDESLVGGKVRLVLRHNIVGTLMSRYSVQIEAHLPIDTTIDLDLDSSNGGIYLNDITGGVIKLDTSNGGLVFDSVEASRIDASTSNGPVSGRLDASDADISTSNGEVNLTLPCTKTSRYVLRTSNAGVDIRVSTSSDVGYDLDLSTSNGGIDIGLPNLDYTQNQKTSKEAHTEGFAGKAVKITIDASTSNGSIDVDN